MNRRARSANNTPIDPRKKPVGLQVGESVFDIDTVAALLADQLLDGPRPVLGNQRHEYVLRVRGWCGLGAHGSSFVVGGPGGLLWQGSRTAGLVAWLACRELTLSVPRGAAATGGAPRICLWNDDQSICLHACGQAHGLERLCVTVSPLMPPRLPGDPQLGRAVRHLREERSLTQEELASRAGMTFGTVSRIESAKSAPAWWTVRKIAEALGVSMAELAAAVEVER